MSYLGDLAVVGANRVGLDDDDLQVGEPELVDQLVVVSGVQLWSTK